MWRFLASMCVVMSLLFSGCGPVISPSPRPTIYAFSAHGCLGCIQDKPRIDQLEQDGYRVIRIDVIARPDWRQRYKIVTVPFYLVVCNGTILLRTNNLNLVIRTVNNGCKVQR